MQSCLPLLVCLTAVATSTATAVAAQSPAEDLLKAQQRWQINCMPRGCIGSVDILRGESGDPPNAHDQNQYISVAVSVDRKDQRPSAVIFQVDPHADKGAGVNLYFAHTIPDGTRWKTVMNEDSPVRVPIEGCDDSACVAAIGGGGDPDEATMKLCSDLVKRMQSGDHLIVTYVRGHHTYRTAVSLKLFSEAYEQLLHEAAEPIPPTDP